MVQESGWQLPSGGAPDTIDLHVSQVQDPGQQSHETDDAEAQSKAVEQAATDTDRKSKGKTLPPAAEVMTGTTKPSSSQAVAPEKTRKTTLTTAREGHTEPSSLPEPWSQQAKFKHIYTAQSKKNLQRFGGSEFEKTLIGKEDATRDLRGRAWLNAKRKRIQ